MSQPKIPFLSAETNGHSDRALPEMAYSLFAELSAAMVEMNRTVETAHSEALKPLAAPAAAMVREQVKPIEQIVKKSPGVGEVAPTNARDFPIMKPGVTELNNAAKSDAFSSPAANSGQGVNPNEERVTDPTALDENEIRRYIDSISLPADTERPMELQG